MSEEPPGSSPSRSPARAILDQAFERVRIPSLAQRAALGVLLAIGVYIAAVSLPIYALHALASQNIPINLSESSLTYYGVAWAILAGATYIVRPYRAYGPLAMSTDAAAILYLFVFYAASPLGVSLTGSSVTSVSVGYTAVILLFMLVAVFYLAGNAVTTYEDLARPGERLYSTYPTRGAPASWRG